MFYQPVTILTMENQRKLIIDPTFKRWSKTRQLLHLFTLLTCQFYAVFSFLDVHAYMISG